VRQARRKILHSSLPRRLFGRSIAPVIPLRQSTTVDGPLAAEGRAPCSQACLSARARSSTRVLNPQACPGIQCPGSERFWSDRLRARHYSGRVVRTADGWRPSHRSSRAIDRAAAVRLDRPSRIGARRPKILLAQRELKRRHSHPRQPPRRHASWSQIGRRRQQRLPACSSRMAGAGAHRQAVRGRSG
jgi:hypothetical protein